MKSERKCVSALKSRYCIGRSCWRSVLIGCVGTRFISRGRGRRWIRRMRSLGRRSHIRGLRGSMMWGLRGRLSWRCVFMCRMSRRLGQRRRGSSMNEPKCSKTNERWKKSIKKQQPNSMSPNSNKYTSASGDVPCSLANDKHSDPKCTVFSLGGSSGRRSAACWRSIW